MDFLKTSEDHTDIRLLISSTDSRWIIKQNIQTEDRSSLLTILSFSQEVIKSEDNMKIKTCNGIHKLDNWPQTFFGRARCPGPKVNSWWPNPPTTWFCMLCGLRVNFTFLNDWKEIRRWIKTFDTWNWYGMQMSVPISYIYRDTTTPICLCGVCGCSQATETQVLSTCGRDHMACKA